MTIYRKPLTFDMMANALGTAPMLKYICTSANINPMAKYKPINHPSNGPLTEAERRGDNGDIANGILYGLKVGAPYNQIYYIHQADWSYVGRPTGGIGLSPYRLLDFDGYDTTAQPTLSGSGLTNEMEVAFNVDRPLISVMLDWSKMDNNTTGINVAEVIAGAGADSLDWSRFYMYIVIDNYITMMLRGTNTGPIYENGVRYERFSCPALPSNLRAPAKRSVTIVLGTYDSSMLPGNWVELKEGSILGTGDKFCSLPYCVNKKINFYEQITTVIVVENFYGQLYDDSITYTWSIGKDFYSREKRINIVVSKISGSMEIDPSSNKIIEINSQTSVTVGLNDIIIEAGFFPMFGDIYNIIAYFQYEVSQNNWENSASYAIRKEY